MAERDLVNFLKKIEQLNKISELIEKYPTKKKHHDSLMKRGYNHDDPETDKVEERYGMRAGSAGQRQAQSDMVNMNKRANNKAQDQNREMMIRQKRN